MFGYKLVRKKDLEDLSRMQSYAIEALNSIEVTEKSNRRKVIFAKIKSENNFIIALFFFLLEVKSMAVTEDIYVKLDDGRVLKTFRYSYSDFLKLVTLNKFINIGNEMIVSSHIVSFWRE